MLKTYNLVSIGLPTRNNVLLLRQSLDSLINQTYPNFEIIISDNASTDETQTVCQQYIKKDKRIHYTCQKKNIGIIDNFNFVLKKAKGKYFMWASDDDFWDKNFISELLFLLKKYPEAEIAMSNFSNIFQEKSVKYSHFLFNNATGKFQTLTDFVRSGELAYLYGLYRTDILKKIGGYHTDSRPFFKSSDYLTIFKVLLHGKIVFTNRVLFYKRDTGLHFARFDIFKNLVFNREVISKMIRYAFFPLLFIYNLFYSLKYIFLSDFNIIQKMLLANYVFIAHLKNNLQFIYNIAVGLVLLSIGVFRKLL